VPGQHTRRKQATSSTSANGRQILPFFHLIISAGAADKEGTTNLQGADGMHTTDRIRVSKGQVMMRLGAVVFVTTGLFLGALLAALAGV
jgi:hypothetical protein